MTDSDSELKSFIVHFADAKTVAEATRLAHGQDRFFVVPALIGEAAKLGYITTITFEPFVLSNRVYGQKAVLTSAGRIFCGLSGEPKPVKLDTLF